jgi:hypothetical protein
METNAKYLSGPVFDVPFHIKIRLGYHSVPDIVDHNFVTMPILIFGKTKHADGYFGELDGFCRFSQSAGE